MIKKITVFTAPLKVIGATCLSMLLIIAACKKDQQKNTEPPDKTFLELKNWFINEKLQLVGTESLKGFVPVWDDVNKSESSKEFVCEVNLENSNNIFTTRKEIDTKNAASYSKLSLFKLILIKDKNNNSIKAAYMNIISEDDNQILNNIHYKKVTDFTGVIQYYNLDGTYNYGWHYTKGKLDVKFTFIDQNSSKATTESICGSQPIYQTICSGPDDATFSCTTTQIGGGYYQCDRSLNPDTGGGGFDGGGGGGSPGGIPTISVPKADHQLPKAKLPPNNTTDKQVLNTCVFKTMEWISKYFGGSEDINSIVNKYAEATHEQNQSPGTRSFLLMTQGVPEDELNTLVSMFFEIKPTESITKSIDAGNPLMGTIVTDDANIGHEVMITGYNNNGSVQYFDPQTGKYSTKNSQSDFSNLITIKSKK